MRLGIAELIVIALVAIAFFKPEKLKDYMVAIGKAANTYKETKEELTKEAKDIVDPVMNIKNDVEDAVKGEF